MELRHLRYFVAVAEEGHITRAALRLGLQQPPLSQQIRALEAELGVALFTHQPRGVSLTPAGAAFLEEARIVLAGAERAATRATQAASGQTGELVLGVTTSALLYPMTPQVLGSFARHYPAVSLKLIELNAADLTDMLAAGSVDAGLLRAVVARPLGVEFLQLCEEPMLVALAQDHPMTRSHRAVPLPALAGERFILVRRHAAPGMYADLLQACRSVGFEPNVVAEVGRMLTNISLVAAGVGISVVPASMQEISLGGVAYRPIAAPVALRAPLTLALREADARPVVNNFRSIAPQIGAPAGRSPIALKRVR